MAAQDVALMAPDRVASLVLLGSSARMVGSPVIEQFIVAQLLEDTWRPALESRGKRWPEDVYRLTALDVDPAAENWLLTNWVTEITADPAYLAELAAKTADVPLGTWLGVGRALLAFDNVDRLGDLSVPTLVLWGSQDAATPEADQILLRSALDVASRRCRTSYVWKRYGREPLPTSGLQESDFGHNFHWGAPEQVAADLSAWLGDGAPTADFHFVDPSDRHTVVTAPGAAQLLRGPACS
jgi:pimeloyl-ACP methyl ester carboxylesterase